MKNDNFKYSEDVYSIVISDIEDAVNFKLTEFEAGLCRAMIDIKSEDIAKSPCLGSHFKKETKRFISNKLLHADTFKYTGVAVPTNSLKAQIIKHVTRLKAYSSL